VCKLYFSQTLLYSVDNQPRADIPPVGRKLVHHMMEQNLKNKFFFIYID